MALRSADSCGRVFDPIIMVTARDDEVDRVTGLELGADTTSSNPSGSANSRRDSRCRAPDDRRSVRERNAATWTLEIDRREHRVLLDGEELAITPKEFDLLARWLSTPAPW